MRLEGYKDLEAGGDREPSSWVGPKVQKSRDWRRIGSRDHYAGGD